MSDIANLIIRVSTTGTRAAENELGKLGKAAAGAAAGIASLETARRVFASLVDAQRQTDKMNASLITMTGSAENAAKAMGILQDFARTTPYGLEQSVTAFTKLVALGLNPSKEALISFGNTAAAMGKDLDQMIEAVADAATGEFERLKEFGIKSKQQGDTVTFTFNNVSTTVKKNSKDIQQYLENIGNTNFAGAMAARANTLDGALSSLEDTVFGLKQAVAASGFGDAIEEQARKAEVQIQRLTDLVSSGVLISTLEDWKITFNDSFSYFSDALNSIAFDAEDSSSRVGMAGEEGAGAYADGFKNWLPTIQQFFKDIDAELVAAGNRARATGAAIKAALTPGENGAGIYDTGLKVAQLQLDLTKAKNEAEADGIRQRSADRQKEMEEKRRIYEEERKNRENTRLESLAKNGGVAGSSGASGPSASEEKAAKAAERLADQQRKQAEDFINTIRRQNRDELAAIDEQERQKLAKLEEFRRQDAISQQQYEATKTQIAADAETERQEEMKKRRDTENKLQFQADSYLEQLRAQNEGELAEIDRQNDEKLRKLEEFHAAGRLSEEQYQRGLLDIAEATDKARLDNYTGTLGDVTNALKNSLGEGNALYKAAAITQTIIETYKGATAAYASLATIPIVGPGLGIAAAAAITASGLANVARIRSAREQGGNLSAGQISTIAERGQPEVIMPAGASRVRTAQQMRQIMGENGGKGGDGDIMIINQTTGRIDEVQRQRDDEGRLRLIIREQVSADLQDSNSDISKSRKMTRGQPGH